MRKNTLRTVALALGLAAMLAASTAQAEVKIRETFFPDQSGMIEVELYLSAQQVDQLVSLFQTIGQVQGSDIGTTMENFLRSGAPVAPYEVWPAIRRLATALTGQPPTGIGQSYYVNQINYFVQGDTTVIVAELLYENIAQASNENGITTDFTTTPDGLTVTVDPAQPLFDYLPQSPDVSALAGEGGTAGGDVATALNNLMAESQRIASPLTYTMVMPGEVVDTNAPRTSGREAIWEYTLEELQERQNVVWTATSAGTADDLESMKTAFATDLQNAIAAYNASQPETAVVADMMPTENQEPKQFNPRSAAASYANSGYEFMRKKMFNEAIAQYELAQQEDKAYQWIYAVAVFCAENQHKGIDFLASQAPLNTISLGDYFGWNKEQQRGNFAATHNPAAYNQQRFEELRRQQLQQQYGTR